MGPNQPQRWTEDGAKEMKQIDQSLICLARSNPHQNTAGGTRPSPDVSKQSNNYGVCIGAPNLPVHTSRWGEKIERKRETERERRRLTLTGYIFTAE